MTIGIKISQMTSVAALTGGDLVPIARGTNNNKFDLGTKIVAMDAATTAGLALKTNVADLAASGGAGLVGFLQSGTGATARTAQAKMRDALNVKDYGAIGNGTAADTAFAAARAQAIAQGGGRIIIPSGQYLLTNFAFSGAGIVWEGDGESTRLTVGANNSNVINITADRCTLKGVKIEGDGTSSSSANGNGLYITGADALIEDVWFTGMGWAGVGGATTTAKRGPKLIRTRHRLTATNGYEVFLGGGWQNILIEDADMLATSALSGVLIYDSGAGLWENARITRGYFEGYANLGVGCTDEGWDGTDRVFGFTVDGAHFKDTGWSAVKAKLSKGVRVVNCTTNSCGGTPENGPSGLYGTILLNSIGQIDVSHNTLKDNGDGGIVINGNDGYPKSLPGGKGLASVTIGDNHIDGLGLVSATYGDGVVALGRIMSVDAHDNHVRRFTRNGFWISGSSTGYIQNLALNNNSALESPTASLYGYRIGYVRNAQIDGNNSLALPNGGYFIEYYTNVQIGAADRSGDHLTTNASYSFDNGGNGTVTFEGNASCTYYDARANTTAYTEGQRLQNTAGNIYEVVVAGTTGGTAPTGTDFSTTYVDGTVRWAYVGKYRLQASGLTFSNSSSAVVKIGSSALFEYVATPIAGTPPTAIKWASIMSGTATFATAATVTVTLTSIGGVTQTQPDALFNVLLSPRAAETFHVSARTTSSFTLTSSNVTSTAAVGYRVVR
jgi:hypothetical protein